VVRDEDYKTGLQVQEALASGARNHSLFGRNEYGGQRFHGWVQRLLGPMAPEFVWGFRGAFREAFSRFGARSPPQIGRAHV
jgi:hypothetical protein